jgi:hypothetical protein
MGVIKLTIPEIATRRGTGWRWMLVALHLTYTITGHRLMPLYVIYIATAFGMDHVATRGWTSDRNAVAVCRNARAGSHTTDDGVAKTQRGLCSGSAPARHDKQPTRADNRG